MRQSQKGNRPRNKNGRKVNGASVNRVYESTGPEGKVRGTPQQIIEKYQSLARDKATAGDRILAESFLQHAEHYVRMLTAAQAMQPQPRRDEREEDEAETPDQGAEGARSEGGSGASDGLAVIDGDESASDMVETPESLSQPRRNQRRRAASDEGDDDEGGRRRQRRAPRRQRDAGAESGAEPAAEAAPDAPASTGLEVVEPVAENADEENWSGAPAVGHA